ncbi:hypothetical protein NDU88_001512 [Pleurodeles waltl]|uniref:Uncharacterized protein n=1 Tax=Pleurodeles waltl TaxID=8319 RepID=A0AAV7MKP9_PLEWA|nr:hypothetical protein NDU88_001512 [Pleurodeles waltl]
MSIGLAEAGISIHSQASRGVPRKCVLFSYSIHQELPASAGLRYQATFPGFERLSVRCRDRGLRYLAAQPSAMPPGALLRSSVVVTSHFTESRDPRGARIPFVGSVQHSNRIFSPQTGDSDRNSRLLVRLHCRLGTAR